MKFYFGQVPHDVLDDFGDDDLFYNEDQGEFYYYCVEFGTNPGGMDEVALHDTAGRYVPVPVDMLRDLAAVLVECNNINAQIQQAENLQRHVQESGVEATVNHGEVDYGYFDQLDKE